MSRGRKVGLAALAVAVAVVVLGAAGAAYAALATPLEYGQFAAAPTGGRETGVPYEGRMQYQVPFVAEGEVAWAVEVRNPLLLPVTITGIHPTLSELAPLVASEELRLPATDPVSLEAADRRPFEPVTLGPGERATLVVVERFAACGPAHEAWAPGGGVVRTSLPLDVTVVGLPRTVEVPLTFAILYASPPGACPAG